MAWPKVTVAQLNLYQGSTDEIERKVLFIGRVPEGSYEGTPYRGLIDSQSNIDVLLPRKGTFRNYVDAAMRNGGQNWSAYVYPLVPTTSDDAWVDIVMDQQALWSAEGVVLTDPIRTQAAIKAAQNLREQLINKWGRWVWFILATEGPQQDEASAAYVNRLTELQKNIVAPAVQLVPAINGDEPGILAGRLCNRVATVADSPARVRTGPLVVGSPAVPWDDKHNSLDITTLQALERVRYSVPMWYPDYDGFYWSDGRTLDVMGGDFETIESLRIVDKVARRVRMLAIRKIGDRTLNSTPSSIAANQMYFAGPLRDMSVSSQINGIRFPGEVQTPRDQDVSIVWMTPSEVTIYIVIRPVNSPKQITVGLLLDTTINQEAA